MDNSVNIEKRTNLPHWILSSHNHQSKLFNACAGYVFCEFIYLAFSPCNKSLHKHSGLTAVPILQSYFLDLKWFTLEDKSELSQGARLVTEMWHSFIFFMFVYTKQEQKQLRESVQDRKLSTHFGTNTAGLQDTFSQGRVLWNTYSLQLVPSFQENKVW